MWQAAKAKGLDLWHYSTYNNSQYPCHFIGKEKGPVKGPGRSISLVFKKIHTY